MNPLRRQTRPPFGDGSKPLRVVDLFAGCGGLTLGAGLAATSLDRALDVRLAVDFEKSATAVYEANFPEAADIRTVGVETLFADPENPELTKAEAALAHQVGRVDVLMGGPPCQGHSNLNNHTRRNDPKNALYLYMVRAARVTSPDVVLIENVPAVLHDTFDGRNVVTIARQQLEDAGYQVDDAVVSLVDLGVAQKRKRHILLATRPSLPEPAAVFETLLAKKVPHRTLRWAIADLAASDGIGFDKPPAASVENKARMLYLLAKDDYDLPNHLRPVCHQGEHSYTSMYGRLNWDAPAQTITSGYGSIGQGRYMHPSLARALTPHEAARLQGFPDFFSFSKITGRTDLATMIGNAVPPQLSEHILKTIYQGIKTD